MNRASLAARPLRSLLTVGFLVTCALIWWWMDVQRREDIDELVELQVTHQAELIQRDITASVQAVEVIAARMAARDGEAQIPFSADADFFIRLFPGARAVSFLDTDHRVAEISPASFHPNIGLDVAAASETRRRPIELARDTGRVTVSDPLDIITGSTGRAFAVFFPIRQDGRFRGTISLYFEARAWLDHLRFSRAPRPLQKDFATEITLNGQPLMRSADFDSTALRHVRSAEAEILNGRFRITLMPRPQYLARQWHWMPEAVTVVLVVGFIGLMACFSLLQRVLRAEEQTQDYNMRLVESNASLRAEVDVRQRAEMEARRARAASEKFLATMSHEIRTPLNAIMGMFQLIEGADIPERQRRQARTGLNASERLFRELTHVIDSARLDAGAVQIAFHEVEMEGLLQEWGALLRGLVQRSGKELAVDLRFADDLPERLLVDRTRLGQIVTNLLDNAVKFSPEGKVMLRVRPDDDAPDTLVLSVSDSGPGVPEELRQNVFDRFYQINDGEARPFQGSGLGLAISRELAHLMGGSLEVGEPDSDLPGNGATFRLRLPGALPESTESASKFPKTQGISF
jgi:signal transduction histidine kinase